MLSTDHRKDSTQRSDSLSSSEKSEARERQDTLTESTEETEAAEEPSVIAGGKTEGWTPVSAIVLWRRIIGLLGNVNKIKEQDIHAKVFEHLIDIWSLLHTVIFNDPFDICCLLSVHVFIL